MKKNVLNLFRKGGKTKKEERKGEATVSTEFVKGISIEENPFENETPEDVRVYDLDGNEVKD